MNTSQWHIESKSIQQISELDIDATYRHALVAHALSMVLDLCPHDPTLLTLLLQTTVSRSLLHESRVVLRALLQIAIPQTSGRNDPLCHPAHAAYLSELLSRWITPPSSASNNIEEPFGFNIISFMDELLPVMFENASTAIWTGDAVRSLAKDIKTLDFASFTHLTGCFCAVIMTRSSDPDAHPDRNLKGLRPRFVKWMKYMLQDLHHSSHDGSVASVALSIVADFVVDAANLNVHTGSGKDADSMSGALVTLATACLASTRFPSVTQQGIIIVLAHATVHVTTYDPLVLHLFPHKSQSGASSALATSSAAPTSASLASTSTSTTTTTTSSSTSPTLILQSLKQHARALRTHHLRSYEASLWACALRHLDREWMTERALQEPSFGAALSVADLREELARRAEEAEHRRGKAELAALGLKDAKNKSTAKAGTVVTGGVSGKENADISYVNRRTSATTPASATTKVWDDFAGCWIAKTPARPGVLDRDAILRSLHRSGQRVKPRRESEKEKEKERVPRQPFAELLLGLRRNVSIGGSKDTAMIVEDTIPSHATCATPSRARLMILPKSARRPGTGTGTVTQVTSRSHAPQVSRSLPMDDVELEYDDEVLQDDPPVSGPSTAFTPLPRRVLSLKAGTVKGKGMMTARSPLQRPMFTTIQTNASSSSSALLSRSPFRFRPSSKPLLQQSNNTPRSPVPTMLRTYVMATPAVSPFSPLRKRARLSLSGRKVIPVRWGAHTPKHARHVHDLRDDDENDDGAGDNRFECDAEDAQLAPTPLRKKTNALRRWPAHTPLKRRNQANSTMARPLSDDATYDLTGPDSSPISRKRVKY
jgi:hypothetical protein